MCEVLDEHLAADRPRRLEARAAVVGCVPWLTSAAVADRLARMGACCIVINKDARRFPTRLLDGRGMPNVLPGLDMTTPFEDGEPTVLGPSSPMPAHLLGPVRVAGWAGTQPNLPLLHAKILVLGELAWYRYGPNGDDAEELRFQPESVWWGSANWTAGASAHLEVGTWCDDDAIVDQALGFVSTVIEFSEPLGTGTVGPEPNLVPVEFDDDAMWQALEEQGLDRAEEPDEDW